ncbi:MAG: hypothetical protein NWE92_11485 [Candidatus Bathyarchaeota archaeon]|nr:hypothetical protein [Candidatus Bathyarchaeota archaeon]
MPPHAKSTETMQDVKEHAAPHTITDAEKQCSNKTGLKPLAVLWHPVNRYTHTKRETKKRERKPAKFSAAF